MRYAWLVWNLILIAVWLFVYISLKNKESRKEMAVVSLWSSISGLMEPLFVPDYWNPPSLFGLAQKTGFDIESLLFAFGTAGLAVVLYEKIFPVKHEKMPESEQRLPRHRLHRYAILSSPVTFLLLTLFTNLNPIYSVIISLLVGGLLTLYCRPDLKIKMGASALIFGGFYFIYFLTLIALYPGYVEMVWNLKAISGVLILGIPLEELLFALSFGFLWSSIYEHFTWRKLKT